MTRYSHAVPDASVDADGRPRRRGVAPSSPTGAIVPARRGSRGGDAAAGPAPARSPSRVDGPGIARRPPRADIATERDRIVGRVQLWQGYYDPRAVPVGHLVDWLRSEGWSRGQGESDLRALVRAGRLVRTGGRGRSAYYAPCAAADAVPLLDAGGRLYTACLSCGGRHA